MSLPPQNLPPPNNRREKQISPPPKQTGVKKPRATRVQIITSQVEPGPTPALQEDVEVVDSEDRDVAIFPVVREYEPRDRNDFAPTLEQVLEQQLEQLEKVTLEGIPFVGVG
jgi:hypothetical protein